MLRKREGKFDLLAPNEVEKELRGVMVWGKWCHCKKEANEQFGRKMNHDVNGNRKLFRKEVNKANGEKVESCNRMKDGNG